MEEKAKEYCKKIDESQGEAWSNDYEVLPMYMADFARKVNESLIKENKELKEENNNLNQIVKSVIVSLKQNGLESFAELVESKLTPKN